jgi:hypothetical protein
VLSLESEVVPKYVARRVASQSCRMMFSREVQQNLRMRTAEGGSNGLR